MDINDLIDKNKRLVYKQLAVFNLLHDQDAESFAYEALYKAILTFKADTGAALSTYAVCCINNALRMHIRSNNRKRKIEFVSYDAPLMQDESFSIADTLEHPESVEQALISKEESKRIARAFKEAYKSLSPTHKKVIRAFYASAGKVTQRDIASAVGLTQATVSKIVSAFRHNVKVRMEEDE